MTAFNKRPNLNIHYDAESGRWRVKIIRDGVTHHLGRFDTEEEARAARDAFPPKVPRKRSATAKGEATRQWKEFLKTPARIALQKAIDESTYQQIQRMVDLTGDLTPACRAAGITPSQYAALARNA